MEVGVKIYPHRLNDVSKMSFADFIELMITPSMQSIKNFDAHFSIHVPHSGFNFNAADKRLVDFNSKILNHSIKFADKLKSKFIVVHAGNLVNKSCSVDNAIKFLKNFDDPRIIIENQCYAGSLNTLPKDLKSFARQTNHGICFDFSHAVVSSFKKKVPYKSFIKNFLKIKPDYFHLCDGFYSGFDNHKNLGSGNLDIDFFKSCINKPVVLEVETHASIEQLKSQVGFLKSNKSARNFFNAG